MRAFQSALLLPDASEGKPFFPIDPHSKQDPSCGVYWLSMGLFMRAGLIKPFSGLKERALC